MKNHFAEPVKKYMPAFIISLVCSFALAEMLVKGFDIISMSADMLLSEGKIPLKEYGGRLVFYIFASAVCSYIKVYAGMLYGTSIVKDIKNSIAGKLVRVEYDYYEKNGLGKTAVRVGEDIRDIQSFFCEALPEIVSIVMYSAVIIVYIFSLNRLLLLAVAVSYPFVFAGVKLISKRVSELAKNRKVFADRESMEVYDIIGGMDIVKSYDLYDTMSDRLKKAMLDIFGVEAERARITSLIEALRMLLKWLPSVICLCFGAVLALKGVITAGRLMVFVLITERFFEKLSSLPYYINEIFDTRVSAERINILLNEKEEAKGGGKYFKNRDTAVSLENVCFSHGENKVFENLNLKIKRGERVAVVGSSGGGKTTLLNIICGLYRPSSGTYRLFGTDFESLDKDFARSKTAVIFQDSFLFPVSLRENAAYGKEGAKFSEIAEACKAANIHDFIMSLPQGYETYAGERGVKLSGGERQRLLLARAMLRKAEILIMDEPSSALDKENERLLKRALNNLDSSVTVIITAHRLTTTQDCGRIIVMEKGKICEEGSYDELLSKKGRFYELYCAWEAGETE